MTIHPLALVLVIIVAVAPAGAAAQWRPTGQLASVLVVDDCNETGGDVMVSRLDPPTVYVCPTVVKLVHKDHPGAEQFFLVHEFGHIALQTSDEAMADCWAARELATARNGRRALDAAIALFRSRAEDSSRRYGSPQDRAERIQRCATEALP
jgi:CDP-diacylglycerol pyrophosphatase